MSRSVRTGLYSIFESFTTFFAVVTTTWMCTLLFNNAKPHSTHLFARFITHIYSLGFLTIIWLALALMLSPQLPYNCDYTIIPDAPEDKWCSLNATSVTLASMICVFCMAFPFLSMWCNNVPGPPVLKEDSVDSRQCCHTRRSGQEGQTASCASTETDENPGASDGVSARRWRAVILPNVLMNISPVVFGSIAGFVALFSWIWASVLLSYNYRPDSRHALTSAKAHLVSYATLTVVWLVLSICLTEQLPQQCNFEIPSDGEASIWCMADSAAAGLGWILTILCLATTTVVYKSTCRGSTKGISVNIALYDKGYQETV
ncbi:hypothetical protein ARMGADRAFT_1025421 [Armillaria gallica]|uniref:Uncharacterized protein n=1 Tax=Armillaria gallica TaxID=47427 RepID=A0A2H3E5Z7_ARMGA|nr:hypothetical protein ARMGADRAFT_1025421 [Armillaria gallica]